MTGYQWLLMLHVTGAFFLLGGSAVAGIIHLLALRTHRPSEIALLLGLVRFALPVLLLGSLMTLVLGLWLVHHVGYRYGAFWVWGAIVLWVIGNTLGKFGGAKQEQARELALELAGNEDRETNELRSLLRDPLSNAMSWGADLAIYGVLVLMVWKPGQ
ncbi:MAG: DUF2269 family protein [Gaiellaceae bacterium]